MGAAQGTCVSACHIRHSHFGPRGQTGDRRCCKYYFYIKVIVITDLLSKHCVQLLVIKP